MPFVFEKFKIVEPHPVIIIAGGMETGQGKFYAGIARAAYKTDAVIIDSGIATGIEPFTMRKGKEDLKSYLILIRSKADWS